ncbi:MAG: 50S ribosomal protein L29 [Clostridia bacterium]|nr:50S ribosomal protein L29 [Clostridia bacterium]
MAAKTFHELTTIELENRERDLKKELFDLRFQMAVGQLQNPTLIRQARRNIARVKTILRERELAAAQ